MNSAQKPKLEDLPSKASLLRAAICAAIGSLVILVAVYLPAEYGIDPTGVGDVIGLKEMGEIKMQLAEEAEADRAIGHTTDDQSSVLDGILSLFVGSAYAQDAQDWRDEATFTLAPGKTAEWKLVMTEGQTAQYRMIVEGGRINFDLHGHGSGNSVTYEKGRGSSGSEGEFTAAFDGEHGWFWRNRDKTDVAVTVQVRGEYSAFKDAS